MISNSYCESDIVIFACKVTLKYVYSPFNMFSSPGYIVMFNMWLYFHGNLRVT